MRPPCRSVDTYADTTTRPQHPVSWRWGATPDGWTTSGASRGDTARSRVHQPRVDCRSEWTSPQRQGERDTNHVGIWRARESATEWMDSGGSGQAHITA